MEPDVLVRRAALVALPLLLLVGYLLRSGDPKVDDASKPLPKPLPSSSATRSDPLFAPPENSSEAPEPSSGDELRARVVREPPAPARPSLPSTPAVRLPEATSEVRPPVVAPQGSPCGGLVVRLITMADDPKFAFASMAKGYDQSAEILHVGESIGGYRVSGIEWDRVWVEGKKGRCAVGMHLGVREAEREVGEQASAEAYARLPWVLPYEITSGMFKRSEMDWELSEDAVEKLYERGADVFAGLRVRSHASEDEQGGLELHDVRMDSFLERLGILSGDVLVKIAGRSVTSADDVRESLSSVREQPELVVDLVRNGENYQLMLRVQGAR